MNNARKKELVDIIFEERFSIQVASIYLDSIMELPVLEDGAVEQTDAYTGVTHSVINTNSSNIREALFSSRYYEGDLEKDRVSSRELDQRMVTMADMASILSIDGTFMFNNLQDVLVISSTVDEYLDGLYMNARKIPFYKMPPSKDLSDFKDIVEKLQPIRDLLELNDTGYGVELDKLSLSFGGLMIGSDMTDWMKKLNTSKSNLESTMAVERAEVPYASKLPSSDPYTF